MWGFPGSPLEYLLRFLGQQRRGRVPAGSTPYIVQLVWIFISAFLGMSTVGLIQSYGRAFVANDLPFIVGSFGASAVLIYNAIGSPLAQPRNHLGGHLVSGLAGTIVAHIFKNTPRSLEWLPGALAVAFAIVAMDITGTTHPPGGATAYIAVTGGPLIDKVGWWYPLFPVLAGSLVMFAVAMIVNNVLREYPVYWWGPSTPPPPTPPPIEPLPDTSPLSSSEKPTPQYNDGPESFKIPDGSPRENYHPLDMDSKSLESRPIKTHSGSSNTNLVKSLSSQDSETGNIFVTAGAAAAWAKEKKELLSIIHKLEEEVRCLRNSNN